MTESTELPRSSSDDRSEPIVALRNVNKRFLKRRSWESILRAPFRREYVSALTDISFEIRQGEFFGLLGQNGAGKTTLFKTLATLVLPDSGTARVAGHDVVDEAAAVRQLLTPVIAEERSLFWRLSAYENLRLFAALYGLRGADAEKRIQTVLDIVGLTETEHKLVGMYSSGMKQRLMIGRALLARSRVLLLDEPTRSLDPVAARDFRAFLRNDLVDRHGYTVLLATHNADEALNLCDRVSVLHRGRLLAVGTVSNLVERVGLDAYKMTARKELRPELQRYSDAGCISGLSLIDGPDQDWLEYKWQMTGGRDEVSQLLREIVGHGIPVASFERTEFALADLLERIQADAGHA